MENDTSDTMLKEIKETLDCVESRINSYDIQSPQHVDINTFNQCERDYSAMKVVLIQLENIDSSIEDIKWLIVIVKANYRGLQLILHRWHIALGSRLPIGTEESIDLEKRRELFDIEFQPTMIELEGVFCSAKTSENKIVIAEVYYNLVRESLEKITAIDKNFRQDFSEIKIDKINKLQCYFDRVFNRTTNLTLLEQAYPDTCVFSNESALQYFQVQAWQGYTYIVKYIDEQIQSAAENIYRITSKSLKKEEINNDDNKRFSIEQDKLLKLTPILKKMIAYIENHSLYVFFNENLEMPKDAKAFEITSRSNVKKITFSQFYQSRLNMHEQYCDRYKGTLGAIANSLQSLFEMDIPKKTRTVKKRKPRKKSKDVTRNQEPKIDKPEEPLSQATEAVTVYKEILATDLDVTSTSSVDASKNQESKSKGKKERQQALREEKKRAKKRAQKRKQRQVQKLKKQLAREQVIESEDDIAVVTGSAQLTLEDNHQETQEKPSESIKIEMPEAVQSLMRLVNNNCKAANKIYLAGGALRDLVKTTDKKISPNDYDFVTNMPVNELLQLLLDSNINVRQCIYNKNLLVCNLTELSVPCDIVCYDANTDLLSLSRDILRNSLFADENGELYSSNSLENISACDIVDRINNGLPIELCAENIDIIHCLRAITRSHHDNLPLSDSTLIKIEAVKKIPFQHFSEKGSAFNKFMKMIINTQGELFSQLLDRGIFEYMFPQLFKHYQQHPSHLAWLKQIILTKIDNETSVPAACSFFLAPILFNKLYGIERSEIASINVDNEIRLINIADSDKFRQVHSLNSMRMSIYNIINSLDINVLFTVPKPVGCTQLGYSKFNFHAQYKDKFTNQAQNAQLNTQPFLSRFQTGNR